MFLSPRAAAGFTLVEVMVTVFVVAIGLLAAAGLQTVSKKASVDALQRTTASVLAQDMLERLRSNALYIDDYATAGKELNSAPSAQVACGGTGSGDSSPCDPRQLVTYDLNKWWESLDGASESIATGSGTASAGGLRNPVGCIRHNGNLVDEVSVVIAWRGLSQISQASASNDATDPTSDTCGTGSGIPASYYDPSGGQSYRRVLVLKAHLQ